MEGTWMKRRFIGRRHRHRTGVMSSPCEVRRSHFYKQHTSIFRQFVFAWVDTFKRTFEACWRSLACRRGPLGAITNWTVLFTSIWPFLSSFTTPCCPPGLSHLPLFTILYCVFIPLPGAVYTAFSCNIYRMMLSVCAYRHAIEYKRSINYFLFTFYMCTLIKMQSEVEVYKAKTYSDQWSVQHFFRFQKP